MIFEFEKDIKKEIVEVKEIELFNNHMLFVNDELVESDEEIAKAAYIKLRELWIHSHAYINYMKLKAAINSEILAKKEEAEELEAQHD